MFLISGGISQSWQNTCLETLTYELKYLKIKEAVIEITKKRVVKGTMTKIVESVLQNENVSEL